MTVTGPESTRTDDRRTLHLTFGPDRRPARASSPAAGSDRQSRRTTGDRLMLAAERAFGGWAPTLRLALLMVSLIVAGLAVTVVLAGVVPAVISALVLVAIRATRSR
ncbi:hypothetical protein [Actinokineospora sp.]|uniref:hypothetical protein n=1 Tax=Actinokineospora sp. TaxID=1872133 RepID=UPI004037E5BC